MRRWWPLVAVCSGAFMLLVDVTIVVVALPVMGRDLHASFTGLQWVMDAYALVLAALLLAAGTVADRFGRRRAYLVGLVVFAGASLVCGLAPNAGALVAARAVQGAGAAAMFASTMALLNLAYTGRDRAVAFGVWGAVNGAAAAAGPILGGVLTEQVSWRAIFLVNLPVSAVTVALARAVLAESRDRQARRVDVPGLLAFTTSAGALTYALVRAGERGWTETGTLAWFAVGAVALVGFVVVERRQPAPMFDLGLLRRAAFVGVLTAALVVSVAAFGYTVYLSLWLQSALGLGAVRTGLVMLPMSGAAFLTSALTARLLDRVPAVVSIGLGMALVGVGALAQAGLDADSTWTAVTPGLVISGVGIGVGLPSLSAAAMAAVPARRGGMAAGALNTARQLGLALGIAALGTVFASRVSGHGLTDRAAVASGLDLAVVVAGCVGLAGAALVAVLLRRSTAEPDADGRSTDREVEQTEPAHLTGH